MKRILCFLCVLCGLHSARALDRNAFTFTDYDLKVRITPATQILEASGKVTLRNDTAQPQRNPVLQMSSSLEWHSIVVRGKPVQYVSQPYTSDIDHTGELSEVILMLPQPVAPQGTIEIEIAYGGPVRQDTTRLTRISTPAAKAARSDWDQIAESFTAVRGIGYVAWYPIATEAASLSDGDAVFSAVGAWKQRESQSSLRISVCASSGVVLANDHAQNSASAGKCREVSYKPLGQTVPTLLIGDYRPLNSPPAAIQYTSGHESYARQWATAAEKIAPFTAQWFGERKRPVEIVELPQKEWFPFESGGVLFTPLMNDDPQAIEVALAHQLAHASFSSPRLWMDEGIAHFAQALEREQQEGRKTALAYMDQQLPPLQDAEKHISRGTTASDPERQPLATSTDEVFYRTKAMFVWWMLRDMVGDDALSRALRAYHPEQDKEPSYFQRLLAAQYHRDLEWFFDDWVYRDRGLPDFRVTAVHPRKLLPADWSVTVTVENLGGAGAEVPVMVRAAQGEALKRMEVHAHEKGMVVHIPVPAMPLQAVVNDGSIPESNNENNATEIKTEQSSQ